MVYLPMSYLYSAKYSHPLNPLLKSLREELFTQDFNTIVWDQHRNTIHPADIYHPHSIVLDTLNYVLVGWKRYICPDKLQEMAREHVYKIVCNEDDNSEGVCLGPVNNPLNAIVRFIHEGPDGPGVELHRKTMQDYFWVKHEGMLVNGTDGVQCWDTSFFIQSLVESGLGEDPKYRDMVVRALEFLEDQQIREDAKGEPGGRWRFKRKGAWPFSKRLQGYTVSDTTAEGLKAVLLIQKMS